MINGKEVDWESNGSVALKKALTSSPKVQTFAVAREVVYLLKGSLLASAIIAPTCLAGTFLFGRGIKLLLSLSLSP